jgi:hypothetical protein
LAISYSLKILLGSKRRSGAVSGPTAVQRNSIYNSGILVQEDFTIFLTRLREDTQAFTTKWTLRHSVLLSSSALSSFANPCSMKVRRTRSECSLLSEEIPGDCNLSMLKWVVKNEGHPDTARSCR